MLGDSAIVLKDIIDELNDKTIFFLDGHYSSGDTGKGFKDVPLIEELTLIEKFYIFDTLIIIDDLRLFGTNFTEDWSEISKEKLTSILSKRICSVIEYNDRLIIKLNKK